MTTKEQADKIVKLVEGDIKKAAPQSGECEQCHKAHAVMCRACAENVVCKQCGSAN